MDAKLQMSLAF